MARKQQVLGNDPFTRGAADRGAAQPEATEAAAAPRKPRGRTVDGAKARPAPAQPKSARKGKAPSKAAARAASGVEAHEAHAQAQPNAAPSKSARKGKAPRKEAPATESHGAQARPETAPPRKAREAMTRPEKTPAPAPSPKAASRKLPPPEPTGLDAAYAAILALRRMLSLPTSSRPAEVDEFGKDPAFEERVRPLLEWIYTKWFRVESAGFDELPRDVPLILVANRAGAIPWDSVMLGLAAQHAGLEVRPLIEDSIFHFPSMGLLVNRLGAVRACPENGERLLAGGGAVAVFPEGATGFGKPFRERYRLQRFGRGGFIKLALRTGALVVPISIVGSEEIHPLVSKLGLRPFGFPFLPITPTFPWLGPAGLLPLPSKWRIDAGAPFDFRSHGPAAAKDEPLVMRLAEEVRGTIQTMLDARLATRRSAFR